MSVIVYLESYDGSITNHAKEIVTLAQKLAELNSTEVVGFAVTTHDIAAEVGKLGIASLKLVKEDDYDAKKYATYLDDIREDGDIVMLPASTWGQEIAAYLSVKIEAAPITDIVDVTAENKFIRNIHSNSVLVTVKPEGNVVVTVRQGINNAPDEQDISPEVTELEVGSGFANLKLTSIEDLPMDRIPLTEADRIVTAGRGVGSKENITIMEDLADTIEAAIGATRAIVDDGWVDTDLQIGQTGKTVSPSLYIAAGVSGAIQHITGMKTSDVIVAINTDEEAPIFDIADYGIVADLNEVIPEMTKQLKDKS